MSEDGISIKRTRGASRVGHEIEPVYVGETRRPTSAAFARSAAIPREVETADVLPSELGGSIDLLLFERMNAVLVSPAMSSMTNRANVLHSVVSWLGAQAERLSAQTAQGASPNATAPWLASVIDTLNEELSLIEAFHKGTLRDVESPLE